MTGEQKFSIRVISQKEEFYGLREEWNHLADRTQATVFQTHEWQYCWWDRFGQECELHIITFRNNGLLVAVFPFFIDCSRIFGLSFCKTLKLIGSIISNLQGGALPLNMSFGGYLDALIDPDYYEESATTFTHIINDNNLPCDHILLDELPPESLLLKMITIDAENSGNYITQEEASACYQIELTESWEEYLGTLSKTTRKKARRGLREVTEKKTFYVRRAANTVEFEQILQRLIELHQQRWNKMGEPGIFADNRVKEFYMEVCMLLFKTGKAVINYCISGDDVFAVELEFRYNGVIYAVQGSFNENSVFSKYSPSKVLFYSSIKEGLKKGYQLYDWLRGQEKYKSSLSNKVLRNKRICYSKSKIRFDLSGLIDSLKRHLQHERQVIQTLALRENRSLIKTAAAYVISIKHHF